MSRSESSETVRGRGLFFYRGKIPSPIHRHEFLYSFIVVDVVVVVNFCVRRNVVCSFDNDDDDDEIVVADTYFNLSELEQRHKLPSRC